MKNINMTLNPSNYLKSISQWLHLLSCLCVWMTPLPLWLQVMLTIALIFSWGNSPRTQKVELISCSDNQWTLVENGESQHVHLQEMIRLFGLIWLRFDNKRAFLIARDSVSKENYSRLCLKIRSSSIV